MEVLGSLGFVLDASARTQDQLQTTAQRLSSGLRINTAADDPSGLAIAESLATKVAGIDQGVREIQNATNALTVAESAMGSIGTILQRMRALVVEARSDLVSNADRGNIQAELNQLRLEIDRIAQGTTFNGRPLLDGSASSTPPQPPQVLLVLNPAASGGGQLYDTTVDPQVPNTVVGAQQIVQQMTVDSFDPLTNNVNITLTIGSQDPSFGPDQVATLQVLSGTNFPAGFSPPTVGNPTITQQDQNGNPVLAFNIGTLTQADVGARAVLVTIPGQTKAAGGALTVNSGNAEGSVTSVDIPGVSAQNLAVNEVVLGNDLENEGAEYRVDYAISTLGSIRASVGAQTVSLQAEASDDNVASINLQASESAIRDVNVGEAATAFTRDQLLVNFQTRLVSDAEVLSQNVATLVADSIVI